MDRNEVMNKAIHYKELSVQFINFCGKLVSEFPPGNGYDIEIGSGTDVDRKLIILKRKARLTFGFEYQEDGQMLGTITFFVYDKDDETIQIAKIYFDKLGNWKSEPIESSWAYSISDKLSYTNNLSVIILNGFLSNPQP